jgi:hypothetical protein
MSMPDYGEPAGSTTRTARQNINEGALKTAGSNQILNTLGGDYFAGDNSELNNMLEAQVRRLAPQVNAQFGARGGSLGSPLAQDAIARTISDSAAMLYDNERGRQMQALGAIPAFAGQTATSEEPYFTNDLLSALGAGGGLLSLLGGGGNLLDGIFGDGGGGGGGLIDSITGGASDLFDSIFGPYGTFGDGGVTAIDAADHMGDTGIGVDAITGGGGGGGLPSTPPGSSQLFDLGSIGGSQPSGLTGIDPLSHMGDTGLGIGGSQPSGLTGIDPLSHMGDTGLGIASIAPNLTAAASLGPAALANASTLAGLTGPELFLGGLGAAPSGAGAAAASGAASGAGLGSLGLGALAGPLAVGGFALAGTQLAKMLGFGDEQYARNEGRARYTGGTVSGGDPGLQEFGKYLKKYGVDQDLELLRSDWHGEGYGVSVGGRSLFSGISLLDKQKGSPKQAAKQIAQILRDPSAMSNFRNQTSGGAGEFVYGKDPYGRWKTTIGRLTGTTQGLDPSELDSTQDEGA